MGFRGPPARPGYIPAMVADPPTETIALWGPDHTSLGAVATASLGPRIAIAISRGRHPKGYPSVDPNEDAVLASRRGESVILAVVDGHNGFDAAREAMHAVGRALPHLHGDEGGLDLGRDITRRIREVLPSLGNDRRSTGTALLVASIRDGRLRCRAWGDAGLVVVRGGRVRRVDKPSPFLSGAAPPSGTEVRLRVRTGDAVIAATDGLFDFLGDRWRSVMGAAVDTESATTVRGLMDAVFASAGSDNVAIAVAVV